MNQGAARTMFRDAQRRKLISENPFEGMQGGTKPNTERSRYVSRETIAAVLEACPHDEWRLLVHPSRFAGLRIPSEALTLSWDDVDWDKERLTVHSPKTEHHDGKSQRTIPLFPKVREYLDRLWSVAPGRGDACVLETPAGGPAFGDWRKAVSRGRRFSRSSSGRAWRCGPGCTPCAPVAKPTWNKRSRPTLSAHGWGTANRSRRRTTSESCPSTLKRPPKTTRIPTRASRKPGRIGRNRERQKTKKPTFLRVSRWNAWAALDSNQ
jgi:hypothetical protein